MSLEFCYADPDPMIQRAVRIISAISNSYPMEVTTTFAHDYFDGGIYRLIVPQIYGMPDVNQLAMVITVTSDTTFTMDIDSTFFQPFIIPDPIPAKKQQCPQVVPVGEINSSLKSATQNVLPFAP